MTVVWQGTAGTCTSLAAKVKQLTTENARLAMKNALLTKEIVRLTAKKGTDAGDMHTHDPPGRHSSNGRAAN